jgi:hypothetical protein
MTTTLLFLIRQRSLQAPVQILIYAGAHISKLYSIMLKFFFFFNIVTQPARQITRKTAPLEK